MASRYTDTVGPTSHLITRDNRACASQVRKTGLASGFFVSSLLALSPAACNRPSPPPSSPVFLVDRVPAAETTYSRAQLASFPRDQHLSAAVTLGDETRRSLTPSWSSPVSFTLRVPPDPVLQFAVAVATLGKAKSPFPVEFRLSVNAGQREETIFKEAVDRPQRNQWLDREADLSRWAGSMLRLTFETTLVPVGQASPTEDPHLVPLWGNPLLASVASRSERPHLVLISIDCLRADHVGTYGYARATTPSIDRFAKEAVVFETAVSAAPYTLASHMAMLTGLPPAFHGVTKLRKLARSIPYLPEFLARAGYQTSGIISGAYLSQNYGFERGFHLYRGLHRQRAAVTVDSALDLLRRGPGRSQFLFLHLIDPHWRYLPPEDFLDRFGPRPADIPGLLDLVLKRAPPASSQQIEQVKNLYDAEVAYADGELGRFFDGLRALGLYEQALIVLTADHGEAFYEHEYWQHSETLYEEMIRVPLIVKWPGRSPKERVKRLVSQVDIFSTFLEAAGLGERARGSSLKHYLGQPAADEQFKAVSEITWESPDGTAKKISLRSEELKYIATLTGPANDELAVDTIIREELYHLGRDPAERENLLAQGSPSVEGLRRQLRRYLEEARRFRASRQGEAVVLDEVLQERLRSLGYVQ